MLEPVWRTQKDIVRYYLVTLLWAALALILALSLASITANEITTPLSHLVETTTAIAQRKPPPQPHVQGAQFREMAQITHDLQLTATTLSQANTELMATMRERDHNQQMLRQLLLDLDDKVHARTAQLDEARQSAEAANRAKSEFLASMSHELRTPLNVILGMSELMHEQTLGPLNPRQLESVTSIEDSGRHLLALINDILDLSKIEAGMMSLTLGETNARELGEASLRFVRPQALKKQIHLSADYCQSTDLLHADIRRLKQILVNLLDNAVKFTPEGGKVTLQVVDHPEPAGLQFRIQDSGIGIKPENIEKLFRPFQQIDSALNRKYSGTGLGLALVRRMAEMHGGSVQVTSEPGRGSCFTVFIPFGLVSAEQRPAENGLLAATITSSSTGQPLILIAEDNETNILLYTRNKPFANFRFNIARNGREAIEKTRQEKPDLILMDIQMPEIDGLEATRQLRADPNTKHIPIITLTALATPEDRLRCLEAGASAYLSKPIRMPELTRQVFELLTPPTRQPA